ncbi:MAG TPA: GIY-YIG nuclease family protein [Fodinibius sp.]|nr:GIY-YIG nuclease family protein [Fodinibius sp.]
MVYFLYILRSEEKETYYIGISDAPERRLKYHNGESKGYTQKHRPWALIYTHKFESKSQALAAEQVVKGWKSKKMIRFLVEGKVDIQDYL